MDQIHWVYDMVTIAFILVMIKIFFDRGILASLVELLASFVAFAVAWVFSGPLSEWAYYTIAEPRIVDYIDVQVLAPAGLDSAALGAGLDGGLFGGSFPFAEMLLRLMEKLPFLLSMFWRGSAKTETATQIAQQAQEGGVTLAQAITDVTITPAALNFFASAAFLALFMLALFLCRRFGRALRAANDLPVVGGLNRMLGGLFGGVQAVLIVFVVGLVMKLALDLAEGGPFFSREILEQTFLLRRIMDLKVSYELLGG